MMVHTPLRRPCAKVVATGAIRTREHAPSFTYQLILEWYDPARSDKNVWYYGFTLLGNELFSGSASRSRFSFVCGL